MMRSVIKGIVTGGLVAVFGFGLLSLVFPTPQEPGRDVKIAASTAPETSAAEVPPKESEQAAAPSDRTPAMPSPAGAPLSAPTATPSAPVSQPSLAPPAQIAGTEPAARPEAAPVTPEPQPAPEGAKVALAEPVAPEQPVPVPPPGEVETPALAPAEATGDAAVTLPAPAPGVTEEVAAAEPAEQSEQVFEPEPLPDADIGAEIASGADEGEVPLATVSGAGQTGRELMPQPADAPSSAETDAGTQLAGAPAPMPALPDAPAMMPDMAPPAEAMPEAAPVPDTPPSKPRILTLDDTPSLPGKPIAGFKSAPGVVVDRLPQVSGSAPEGTQIAEAPTDHPDAASLTPLERYAAPFTEDPGKPLFSIVLIDPGVAEGGLDAQTIAATGLPMTIAIDPTRENAASDAETFRKAGYEVAMLAGPLPQGASPEDLEVALEAWKQTLPEAVAVIERPQPEFQNNRMLARQMVSALDRDGLGLVTLKVGFDSANQIAQSVGLPHAQAWRVVDGGREKAPVISRMLSRAGFEADRDGQVVVVLSAWPESLQGIDDWYAGEQGKFALAPVSAVALKSVAGQAGAGE
ncbi:divergent polysaccharide deacetylase family protein [Thioclava pacifica]|uniref:Divergent polysaccharide deacetylase n=1 Tax=Thioclava pacifica DSM 10166 TaxID=1353537 RepID=A0A074JKB7_9RHOB|nr:divergent polysaccharide deacetylase family protein [Thioclava pacifica]KEO56330.1 hypothetical protein TP2_02040 [Thioclava pacifica DSM 10166]